MCRCWARMLQIAGGREDVRQAKWLAGAVMLLAAACGGSGESDGEHVLENGTSDVAVGAESATIADVIALAIANSNRPDADRADDAARKPAEMLAFAGVAPGMTVLELEAGGGYYTELLSQIVGPGGEVIMQNPPAFDTFLADAIDNRLRRNRLANVRLSKTNFDALDAADASVDVVTWVLGPHELYFVPSGGEPLGDVTMTYAEIFRVLKPGGHFIILDHAAVAGSLSETGDRLHRIDSAIIKNLTEAAGFVFVAESDILRNPKDDLEMSVFDPMVRRRTDRFLLKYQKPGV